MDESLPSDGLKQLYINELTEQTRRYHLTGSIVLSLGFLLFSFAEYLTRTREVWLHYTLLRVACVVVIAFAAILVWKKQLHPVVLGYAYSLLIPLFIIYMHLRDRSADIIPSLILVYFIHGFGVLWHWRHSLVTAVLLTSVHLFFARKIIGLTEFANHNGIWAIVSPFAVIGVVAYRYRFISEEIMLRLRLQQSNQMIKQQSEELERQNRQIHEQREMLAHAYRQLTDSIRHAKRIQSAMHPPAEKIAALARDFFLLESPKDTISGDFLWVAQHPDGAFFIAVADCTGHGVPAGFMTMTGNFLLNQIILKEAYAEPAFILEELDRRLLQMLRQNEPNHVKIADGMDIVLVRKDADKLTFAAARRPLWIYRFEEWQEFKGSPYPIGDNFFTDKVFVQHTVGYSPGDVLYLFSDGYIDQFGTSGKRFTTKRFRNLLHVAVEKPMSEQEKLLRQAMQSWQGNEPQTDDWLIVGLRF